VKVGIAFAGGGVRGAAHLGILQAFEEHGIEADMYAGTSAGSIVATMKALGHTNEECMDMMMAANKKLVDIAYWDIFKNMFTKFKNLESILKGNKLRSYLMNHIGAKFLMNTKHGLGIISTDIDSGAQIIFTSEEIDKIALSTIDDILHVYGRYTPLSLPRIVYASCAVPGIFRPMRYNKRTLVDGSITNNLPANVLKAMGADKVIAIDLSKRTPNVDDVHGIFNTLSQSIGIMVSQNTYLSLSYDKDVIKLNPDMSSIGLLDFDNVESCYEAGYNYGNQIANFIKKELES